MSEVTKKFRQELHNLIPKRKDSTMDLIDAISGNDRADSVVKLSLNPLFRRTYNSITDVISHFFPNGTINKKNNADHNTNECEKTKNKLISESTEESRKERACHNENTSSAKNYLLIGNAICLR